MKLNHFFPRSYFSLMVAVLSFYLYACLEEGSYSENTSHGRLERGLSIKEAVVSGSPLYNFHLSFQKQDLMSEAAYSMAVVRVHVRSDGSEMALVEINPSGESCESLYRLVELSPESDQVSVSSIFGTCAPFSELDMNEQGFRMISAEWSRNEQSLPSQSFLPRLGFKEFRVTKGQVVESDVRYAKAKVGG
ncbi:hypothetical protein GW915_04525 [bacterium]|nr:hypothetical protein [bacterium]